MQGQSQSPSRGHSAPDLKVGTLENPFAEEMEGVELPAEQMLSEKAKKPKKKKKATSETEARLFNR